MNKLYYALLLLINYHAFTMERRDDGYHNADTPPTPRKQYTTAEIEDLQAKLAALKIQYSQASEQERERLLVTIATLQQQICRAIKAQ